MAIPRTAGLLLLLCGCPALLPAMVADDIGLLADQLQAIARLHSARFDEEAVQPSDADGAYRTFRLQYTLKGACAKVVRLDRVGEGPWRVSLTHIQNRDGWLYLEGLGSLSIIHRGAQQAGFGDVPLGTFMPTPLLLHPLAFLGYTDHAASCSLGLSATLLRDPAWLRAHMAEAIRSIDQEGPGAFLLHVPIATPLVKPDHSFTLAIGSQEFRPHFRTFPEFGGKSLIDKIWSAAVGEPSDNYQAITYRDYPAADGSGSFTLPSELHVYDGAQRKADAQRILSAALNVPVDDSEFEIDPTTVTLIRDYANAGGSTRIGGEAAKADEPNGGRR